MKNKYPKYDIVIAYPSEKIRIFDTMIPLGIASIIAILQKNGYSVRFVDFNHYNGDFQSDLLKWSPKIIGIGGTTPTRSESFKILKMAKEALPDIPTVYGGVHATFTAKDTLQHVREIDFVLKGEGEWTFLEMCNRFVRKQNVDLLRLPGFCCRQNGHILENPIARIDDLDALPVPVRELEDIGYTLKMDFCGLEADFIMTSRGCPGRCVFCSASAMFPGGFRFRSMDKVQAELEQIFYRKKGIRGLKIFDSTFTASHEHVINFCKMIKPYGLAWECEIRADTVDYSLLKGMKEAGCYYVDIGLESSNIRLLRSLGKNISLQQVEDTLDWCNALNIKTKLFMIFGLLDQTLADCMEDVQYLKNRKDKIDLFATTFGLRIYPGTAIERRLIKRGILPKDFSWAKFKPSRKNWLLLEFGNTYILKQPHLSFFKLLRVGFLLLKQNTLLSNEHILKLLTQNVRNLLSMTVAFLHRKFNA
jgi:anaerobic magnesium-protoporphyrin IX monomethyl ester cyclase